MIYIVEDDDSVRRSFEIFLESAGLEFNSFGSAESFLAGVIPTSEDLLLLDINLPQMNGLELLGKFSQEGINIPTIVISALDDIPTREQCRKYGVMAYLHKPVDSDTLIDLIQYHNNP